MNIDKAQIKAGAVHEVGVRLDDALESARAEVHRADGASAVLDRAAEACLQVMKFVDRDLDEGRIADLETAALVKKWVEKCVSTVRDHRAQAMVAKAQAQGKVAAMETAVAIAKKFVDDERRKIENFQAAVASGALTAEDVGRPPPSIKAQRLAEESQPAVVKRVAKRRRGG